MGDETFGEAGGGAAGVGEEFLRGMEVYTDAPSATGWVSSCFTTEGGGSGCVLTGDESCGSVLMAATMDLVTRVGGFGGFSSFLACSSSLSANKSSSSSSEVLAEGAASFSSLDIIVLCWNESINDRG